MAAHIAKIRDVSHKLSLLGRPISEKMVITKILMTLPTSLNYFSASWESMSLADCTVDNLVTRLIMEKTRLSARESKPGGALAAKENTRAANLESVRKHARHKNVKPGACYKCGKFGHFQKDCRSKIKGNKSEKEQQRSTKEKQEALYSESVFFSSGELDIDVWYLDSGASSHMTGWRDLFEDFKAFQEPTSIKLGNGVEIAAHGKGHISVSVCTDFKWEEKYLEDVIYVPKLAYNLFSMGSTLDKQIKFESNEKECRFVKGDRTVAPGERKERLYAMKMKVIKPENALNAKIKEDKLKNTTAVMA